MRSPTLLFEFRSSAAARVCAVSILLGPVTGLCVGQEVERTPLNSERIEARYGSYGIEVLESDTRIRESNLFSEHAGGRVTRTFAIVQYPEIVHSEFSDEHMQILAGGSIGAVFSSRGWQVNKHNRLYATLAASNKLAAMMRIDPGIELAVHIYVLEIERDATRYEYAAIAEVHHADYLSVSDLERIYQRVPELNPEQAERTEALLRLTAERMTR